MRGCSNLAALEQLRAYTSSFRQRVAAHRSRAYDGHFCAAAGLSVEVDGEFYWDGGSSRIRRSTGCSTPSRAGTRSYFKWICGARAGIFRAPSRKWLVDNSLGILRRLMRSAPTQALHDRFAVRGQRCRESRGWVRIGKSWLRQRPNGGSTASRHRSGFETGCPEIAA